MTNSTTMLGLVILSFAIINAADTLSASLDKYVQTREAIEIKALCDK